MSGRFADVSVFVEAADAGGFSAAATRLNLSRSAVGKSVARLEQRLGVRLFHRTTRTQQMTEDGLAYYERCRKALDELRAGEAMIESGRREVSGRLRVSMPVLFGRRCVAPLLMKLAERHPALRIDMNFNDRMVDLLDDGFDLALRNGPLRDDSGLMARRVALQRMSVCASPGFLARHGEPQALGDIDRFDTLLYGRSDNPKAWAFPQEDGRLTEITPKGRFHFDDLETIADAAVAGFGLAWLPCWLIRDRVADGSLVRVLTGQPGMNFECHAIWPKTTHLPLRVRLAIDTLAANLPAAMETGKDRAA